MRRALFFRLLHLVSVLISANLFGQSDRFAYVISDITRDGSGWNVLRRLDLETGQYTDVLLNGADQRTTFYNASTKKAITMEPDARLGNLLQAPFCTGVAAAAYDRRHNRLYFTPMFVDQLRYLDLNSMKVFSVAGQSFSRAGNMNADEGKIITRMVIASDNYGYAISNDGNTFIRFSTDKKMKIEQLGALFDDPANSTISIHNKNSSFGGDAVADDDGNLYIITAPNHVFKVNIQSKVSTHLGALKNLPAGFTVNGAAVDDKGFIIVSSAVDGRSYYQVDPKNWTAKSYLEGGVFKSSDLANSNVLCVRKSNGIIPDRTDISSKSISIYPNPATTGSVTLHFDKVPAGDYRVLLTDALGKGVGLRNISINAESQSHVLPLNKSMAKGVYMIKVFNKDNQPVYTNKLIVETPRP
jgi:hypothetical protein